MDQKELEIARLNASLAIAKGELKQASVRPRSKSGIKLRPLPVIVAGLGLGVVLGFGLGFTTTGAEQFLRQDFAHWSAALFAGPN